MEFSPFTEQLTTLTFMWYSPTAATKLCWDKKERCHYTEKPEIIHTNNTQKNKTTKKNHLTITKQILHSITSPFRCRSPHITYVLNLLICHRHYQTRKFATENTEQSDNVRISAAREEEAGGGRGRRCPLAITTEAITQSDFAFRLSIKIARGPRRS